MFHQMPPAMRDGYKLSKVMRHSSVCPRIDGVEIHSYITSFMLKTCIFAEYHHLESFHGRYAFDAKYAIVQPGSQDYIKHVVHWARMIYEQLEIAFEQQYLESFFIPGNNLLSDNRYNQFKAQALMYASVCKLLLTPKQDPIDKWQTRQTRSTNILLDMSIDKLCTEEYKLPKPHPLTKDLVSKVRPAAPQTGMI